MKKKKGNKKTCNEGRKQDAVIKVQGPWLPNAREIWRQIMCRKQKNVPDSHAWEPVLKYCMESFLLFVFRYQAAKENSMEKVCYAQLPIAKIRTT